ncbi:hypothetical protein J2809_004249 [Arthrobacter pascens]|nr:hypothetical protein [Arthrobacter pascens]
MRASSSLCEVQREAAVAWFEEGVAYRSRSFSRRNRSRSACPWAAERRTTAAGEDKPASTARSLPVSPARNRFHPGKLEPERVVTAKPAVSQIRHLRLGTTPNGSQQIPRARARGNTLPRALAALAPIWPVQPSGPRSQNVREGPGVDGRICGRVPVWTAGSAGGSRCGRQDLREGPGGDGRICGRVPVGTAGRAGGSRCGWQDLREGPGVDGRTCGRVRVGTAGCEGASRHQGGAGASGPGWSARCPRRSWRRS